MADAFDSLMNNTCSVLGRTAGTQDAAGLTPRTTAVLESGVPCRVSRLTGDELKGVKEISIRDSKIYMRPWAISGSTVSHPTSLADAAGKIELNTDMSIQVGSKVFNIKNVANPSLAYHHFEILVEEVT
jgi:hypothetical protein